MTESQIERAACRALWQMGWLTPKQNGFVGIPDRLMIGPRGQLFWVEFKKPGGQLRPAQIRMIEKLRALGQTVLVSYDAQTVIDYARTLSA